VAAAGLRWRFARDGQAARWRPGDLLPSLTALTERYGVTLAIARDFYRHLEAEGVVEAFHGKGVFLRGALEADRPSRSLNLGVVAFLEHQNPEHRFNRASSVLSAFERKSAALGGTTRLFNLHPTHDVTLAALEEIKTARPDGLLFLPPYYRDAEANLRRLLMLDIPLVLAGGSSNLTHCALHDHRQAAATATAHLRDLGLRKLAFLQFRCSEPWAQERLEGFNHAGGGIVAELDNNPYDAGFQAELDALFPKLLAEGVQGVLCSGDPYAAALLALARRQGVNVPEDLAIAGMDDNWRCRTLNLTTVQLSDFELGAAAYDLLSEVISKPPGKFVERRIPCPLLVRATTAIKRDMPSPARGGR